MRASTLGLFAFGLACGAPSVPDPPPKPPPIVLRRERLNRQLAHTRNGHRR